MPLFGEVIEVLGFSELVHLHYPLVFIFFGQLIWIIYGILWCRYVDLLSKKLLLVMEKGVLSVSSVFAHRLSLNLIPGMLFFTRTIFSCFSLDKAFNTFFFPVFGKKADYLRVVSSFYNSVTFDYFSWCYVFILVSFSSDFILIGL